MTGIFDETSHFESWTLAQLLYMAVCPTFLAYVFWDEAVKRGDLTLVASLSFFTPLLATILTWFFLDLEGGWWLWAACLLVIAGSFLSKQSVQEPFPEDIAV